MKNTKQMRAGRPARRTAGRVKAPATFVEVLARSVRTGGEAIVGLRSAAEMLWWQPRLQGRALRGAMAEVNEATKGQPFRLETPAGPVFAEFALWYFAGRSGGTHCDCPEGRPCTEPRSPAWPKTARQAAA